MFIFFYLTVRLLQSLEYLFPLESHFSVFQMNSLDNCQESRQFFGIVYGNGYERPNACFLKIKGKNKPGLLKPPVYDRDNPTRRKPQNKLSINRTTVNKVLGGPSLSWQQSTLRVD